MNKKGYTLVELIVVVAVIGILAMIAIPAYVGQQKRAARAEAYSNLPNLRLLEEQFNAERGGYTKNLGQSSQSSANNVTCIQKGRTAIGDADDPNNALPGFKPGSGISFNYYIVQNKQITNASAKPPTTAAQTPCFVAYAVGTADSRVAGDVFAIDCNNIRNF